ncbi:MAG: hypothetical protein M3342_06650 [Bacteroidota bacterium]|nr:hypothetical protein [Bacteroidota bacterium]
MKRRIILFLLSLSLTILSTNSVQAQCSICTRTAEQLGEKPAKGLNAGILYLALTPFLIMGFIGYRWWRGNRD